MGGGSWPGRDFACAYRALLSLFAFLFVAIMLADRHQSSDEGAYLRFARHLAEGHYTHESTPDLAARRCI